MSTPHVFPSEDIFSIDKLLNLKFYSYRLENMSKINVCTMSSGNFNPQARRP